MTPLGYINLYHGFFFSSRQGLEGVAKLHSDANSRSLRRFGFCANRLRPQGYVDLRKTKSALRSSSLHREASIATPSLEKMRCPGSIRERGSMILAGDIGGTYARFGLFEKTAELKPLAEGKYLCKESSGLEELIWKFFEEQKICTKQAISHGIHSCCFAIAGPVRDGRCQMTNAPWLIDARELSQNIGISTVVLVNDLEAHARGLHLLQAEDLLVLQKGVQQTGNRALVFAGTGLGEAGIFWDGKQFCPIAGEGGHADFAPRDELEIALFLYLKKKYGHVSYERVVSGRGLYEIYQFLIEASIASVSVEVEQEMKTRNPASVIIEFGKNQKDRACIEALDLFFSFYGAEAGNVALKFMAVGGLYIGGGMVTPLVDTIPQSSFLSSFVNKGRFKGLLESMPVSIVKTGKTALLGAATLARK